MYLPMPVFNTLQIIQDSSFSLYSQTQDNYVLEKYSDLPVHYVHAYWFFILEGGLIWELSYKIEDFYRLCESAWRGGGGV
jgi:hypothetical protein